MPELPEVEILVRHLGPVLRGRTIRDVTVHRAKSVRPDTVRRFAAGVVGAKILQVRRRAKYLLFDLKIRSNATVLLLGHLGMTGRMYVQSTRAALPKHAAVSLRLNRGMLVFEDTRYFGRMTLDTSSLEKLGPEPLSDQFNGRVLQEGLRKCSQPIKPKLLDQGLLAGVGNIYASEALWQARISPRKLSRRLSATQCDRLAECIQVVLRKAIEAGSTIPLDFSGEGTGDGLFYYGSTSETVGHEENLNVYDREGEPCLRCKGTIRRIVQANRSTFYCPQCQRG